MIVLTVYPVVDEEALIKALGDGRACAGLDVYSVEPLSDAGFAYEALRGTSEFVAREVARFPREGKLPRSR